MNIETHKTECPSTHSSVFVYLAHRCHQQSVKFILYIQYVPADFIHFLVNFTFFSYLTLDILDQKDHTLLTSEQYPKLCIREFYRQ